MHRTQVTMVLLMRGRVIVGETNWRYFCLKQCRLPKMSSHSLGCGLSADFDQSELSFLALAQLRAETTTRVTILKFDRGFILKIKTKGVCDHLLWRRKTTDKSKSKVLLLDLSKIHLQRPLFKKSVCSLIDKHLIKLVIKLTLLTELPSLTPINSYLKASNEST